MQGLPAALDSFLGDVYAHMPMLKVTELNMVKSEIDELRRKSAEPEKSRPGCKFRLPL